MGKVTDIVNAKIRSRMMCGIRGKNAKSEIINKESTFFRYTFLKYALAVVQGKA